MGEPPWLIVDTSGSNMVEIEVEGKRYKFGAAELISAIQKASEK